MIYTDDTIDMTPRLASLSMKSDNESNESRSDHFTERVDIKGFEQDTMQIERGTGSIVTLDCLKINSLRAAIGYLNDSPSKLSIISGTYKAALFDIPGKGS